MNFPIPNPNIFTPQINYGTTHLDYPVWALPPTIREAVKEVQAAMKAPMSLVGVSALGATSLTCQNAVDVKLPFGAIAPISLFFIALADSGERKTSIDSKFMRGIERHEKEMHQKYADHKTNYEAQARLWQLQKNALEKKITKLAPEPNSELANRLIALIKKKPVLNRTPYLMAKDITPEALISALRNWRSMGLMSNEAGAILNGRAAEKLPMLNALWDGANHSVLRIGEEDFILSGARLTASLMLQPKTFQKFLTGRGSLARDNGFLARCLITKPFSTQGIRFTNSVQQFEFQALSRFEERVAEILSQPSNNSNEGSRRVIELSADAINAWTFFSNDIELQLGQTGFFSEIKDAASKIAENAARMATLFHVFEKSEGLISLEHMNSAIEICKWHLFEFKKIFDPTPQTPKHIDDARLLEQWIRNNLHLYEFGYIPKNKVLQYGPNPLRSRQRLNLAVEYLSGQRIINMFHDNFKNGRLVIQLNTENLTLLYTGF
jgi:hypothetical protein